MREHYAVRVKLDARERWVIWFSDEVDGFLVEDGSLVAFDDPQSLGAYATDRGLAIDGTDTEYDFDWLRSWFEDPRADAIDCVRMLDAWNLLVDLRSTIADRNVIRDPDGARVVYEKLFWGNNLPAVTPDGDRYEPEWTPGEIATLKRVLGDGLELFRAVLPSGVSSAGE